jgi:hypothetical protein
MARLAARKKQKARGPCELGPFLLRRNASTHKAQPGIRRTTPSDPKACRYVQYSAVRLNGYEATFAA